MTEQLIPGNLHLMLSKQLELQRHMASLGRAIDPTDPKLDQETRIQFIKDMYIALVMEAGEALDEVGWKPWGTARHIHGETMLNEIVDMWHFVMNLMLAAGPFIDGVDNERDLADRFVERYLEKNKVNWERAQVNYDGFAEKCGYCGRDKKEVPSTHTFTKNGTFYCSETHYVLSQEEKKHA